MAIIKKDGNTMGLPMNITRGNPIPLDSTQVWYSFEDAQNYAKNGSTAYVGQVLSIINEDGEASAYVIANLTGDLELLKAFKSDDENYDSFPIEKEDIQSLFN